MEVKMLIFDSLFLWLFSNIHLKLLIFIINFLDYCIFGLPDVQAPKVETMIYANPVHR